MLPIEFVIFSKPLPCLFLIRKLFLASDVTTVLGGIEDVKLTLAPITEFFPMTTSPPKIVALDK